MGRSGPAGRTATFAASLQAGRPGVAAVATDTTGPAPRPARSGVPEQLPGVASQLVSVLSPLHVAPSGSRALTILLHPADLGPVRATITVSGDETTVRLVASTGAGESALRSSLSDLRSGLNEDGRHSIVLLGDHGFATSTGGRAHEGFAAFAKRHDTPPPTAHRPDVAVAFAAPASAAAPALARRLLDIRL